MIDRYTKIVLTLIALALVYLCIIFTPLPRAHAQVPSLRPGEPSGPTQVVIVGYKGSGALPVAVSGLVEVAAPQPLRITGEVRTERSSGAADRVILVGWEENARREKMTAMEQLSDDALWDGLRALPVRLTK